MRRRASALDGCLVATAIALCAAAIAAQTSVDPGTVRAMQRQIRETLERHYYDPALHGVDLNAPAIQARLANAKSTSDVFSALALPLLDLEDQHTLFIPPPRVTRTDYGWSMIAIGNNVFVDSVAQSSDAAKQGLTVGDQVLVVNSIEANRGNLWKLRYILNLLRPQPALTIRVRSPDGTERQLTTQATLTKSQRVIDLMNEHDVHRLMLDAQNTERFFRDVEHAVGDQVLIWRMPIFPADTSAIDGMVRRARGFKSVVLDLRDNGGGAIDGLRRLSSQFFSAEVPIATSVRRKEKKEYRSDPVRQPYTGRLVVLVNSASASASEMFARLVQLQKRGVVIGDRSAGSVMESIVVPHTVGISNVTIYAVSVTVGDVLMPDGGRLEGVGVRPDEQVLPTPEDLLLGRDPQLARALNILDVPLTPEEAGKLFPPRR